MPIKLGKLNPAYFLMIATGEKMSITQIEGSFPQDPLPTKEQREEFVSKWEAVPDEKFKKYFLEWEKRNDISDEATCDIVDWNEAMHYIDDSTRTLRIRVVIQGPVRRRYRLSHEQYSSDHLACDRHGDGQGKIMEDFPENPNACRAVNVRRGLRRKDERPPEDHWAVRDEKYEQELLTKYYEFKGWNSEGIPTRQTLERLDLGYVADDLEQRGILMAPPKAFPRRNCRDRREAPRIETDMGELRRWPALSDKDRQRDQS